MHSGRMHIPEDAHEGSHNRALVIEEKVHSRDYDDNHVEGRDQGYDECFSHDRLRKVVLDELHQAPYSSHPGYQKIVTTMHKLYF